MIAIIDYDAGNLKSVEKALQYLDEECIVTRDKEELLKADKIILPGVGAFGDAMEKLHKFGLVDVIHKLVKENKPFLGICLGLQLMFESSEEGPGVKGLGLLPGKIVKFPEKEGFKIPHMGWNSIDVKEGSRLFKGVSNNSYVYFVHSYYLQAENENDVAATTEYITHVHASVEHDNIFACQFHPEKSGDVGLRILKNFCEL
ncbi:MAG: imidazole glycerol phosphate synthase subunit HisH [Clostridium sp.]|jgi:glutamine amidotransferase|uniref:imidazole glycerol phosphate synthase subunit HisH n=1 Tax=Butyribacter sp. TaxID=2822465 RepID=UPI00033A54B9|nr:imidazole glycerol phosphate synthase subunit HisH [Clostridium sp.]MDY5180960.1 imidazole glycerol phosphate synthase subunit HisH [Butyribacter sp.]CDB88802.1 imidazole glycerol phosphate synthase subunit HisH [Clostridium sp. CAG:253]